MSKPPPGIGALEPERGAAARQKLEAILGGSLLAGYGKAGLTLGVEAAEQLIGLLSLLDGMTAPRAKTPVTPEQAAQNAAIGEVVRDKRRYLKEKKQAEQQGDRP